jgi:hypothetical protein
MREFIDKEIMMQEYRGILGCEIDTEYKHVSDDGVCERTVKNLIEDANTYSEKEIVKPYLHKLAVQILEKYSGLDICEHLDEYDWDENDISYYKQVGNIGDIMDMIDNVLSEQEKDEQRK